MFKHLIWYNIITQLLLIYFFNIINDKLINKKLKLTTRYFIYEGTPWPGLYLVDQVAVVYSLLKKLKLRPEVSTCNRAEHRVKQQVKLS